MDRENNHWHVCIHACMHVVKRRGETRKKKEEKGKNWVEYRRIFFFLFGASSEKLKSEKVEK